MPRLPAVVARFTIVVAVPASLAATPYAATWALRAVAFDGLAKAFAAEVVLVNDADRPLEAWLVGSGETSRALRAAPTWDPDGGDDPPLSRALALAPGETTVAVVDWDDVALTGALYRDAGRWRFNVLEGIEVAAQPYCPKGARVRLDPATSAVVPDAEAARATRRGLLHRTLPHADVGVLVWATSAMAALVAWIILRAGAPRTPAVPPG
ncbi:MAG TPA: hypothetical protein VEI02_13540 [Planctomycetota bacterium]|nr:hypothetical protein [Planctomycetota bacterium]